MRAALLLAILSILLLAAPGSAIMLREDLPTLAEKADRIVTGLVTDVVSEWDAERNLIHSTTTLLVDRVLKGETTEPLIGIRTVGGEVDGEGLWVSVEARFLPGENVFVFLKEVDGGYYEVMGLMQGKYTIEDGIVVERGIRFVEFLEEVKGLRAPAEEPSPFACTIGWLGWKWQYPYRPVFWGNQNGTADCTGEWAAFQKAGRTWNQVSCADFKFVKGGMNYGSVPIRDYKNQIAWQWEGGSYIAATYIWYSGGTILEADILMDDYWLWSASDYCPPNRMDVQNIGTHELGHAGPCLEDNYSYECSEATMYGYADYGETKKRTLSSYDINAFCNVY